MRLTDVTPLLITWNEAPNIGRCLERLDWASRILVVDSGSTDETLAICRAAANVRVIHRPFDSFAEQCNFGLQNIETEWVLSLDADYILPTQFAEELRGLAEDADGYSAAFRYCVFGRPLRGCLYPPRTVLYRVQKAQYRNIGHGHRVEIAGAVRQLKSVIDHDDRKSLDRWLDSQYGYAQREAAHLGDAPADLLTRADKLRLKIWPAVPGVFLYTLLWKRCLLDGWPGWFYTLQRTYAELLLSLCLLQRRLQLRRDTT